ncbi:MAG: OmpA family protein [Myxococcales bacterium]|nr:OmpA family protein [Myxococcales bacterium]
MGRFSRYFGSALVIALFLSMASVSNASTEHFNAQFFKPAIGRNPYFMLHSSETLHKLQFDVGVVSSYAYHPMELRQGTQRVRGIIDQLLVEDFVAAFGILEWLQIGVDFPLVVINKFKAPNDPSADPLKNYFNIGDVRAEFKARVLTPYDKYIGLAFIPFITAPTGKSERYVGDDGLTGGIKVALDARLHPKVALAMNLGYQGGKKVDFRNVDYRHRFLVGGGASFIPIPDVWLFGEVNAQTSIDNFFKDRDTTPAEAYLGARWDIKDTGVTLQAGGGTCLVCGVTGARGRGILSVKYRLNTQKYRQLDSDEWIKYNALFKKQLSADELYALKMNCPDNPAQFQSGVHSEQCPKYYELRELADLVVRCPASPDLYNPNQHDPSCPKIFVLSDTYSQDEIRSIYSLSVSEMRLKCPDDPADFKHGVHDSACPKFYTLKDAVDISGQCPANPADFRYGIDDPSCPKFYMLRQDYGEDQWDTMVKYAKLDAERAGVSGGEVKSLKPVYFAFNSSTLDSQAAQALDQVIATINATNWISRISIEGHADSMGTPAANKIVSEKRANVVISYMRSHGLRPGVDLLPYGHGDVKPAASNETEEGRAKNRRVIFHVSTNRYMNYKPPENGMPASAVVVPAEKETEPVVPGGGSSASPPSRWLD